MTQQKKQWGAIIIMIALFAMIAFVTNCALCYDCIRNESMFTDGYYREEPIRGFGYLGAGR